MQIFIINLPSAVDRLNHMSRQLAHGFNRIEAVDGCAVPARLAANFPPQTQLLPGEIGCYASHLLAAEAVLENSLPHAIILEDDVELVPHFQAAVSAAVGAINGEWDVLSISGAKQHPHRRIAGPFIGDIHLVKYLHFPKTTAAYVISASGAKKLLVERPRRRPVDVDIRYGWEMGLRGYGVFPPLAVQSSRFASSIPKARRRRFYWRSNPAGYLLGRAAGVVRYLAPFARQ